MDDARMNSSRGAIKKKKRKIEKLKNIKYH